MNRRRFLQAAAMAALATSAFGPAVAGELVAKGEAHAGSLPGGDAGATMLISIHQSHYLPSLDYVDKIARSDLFVVLDDVDFTRHSWQNRNRLKSAEGSTLLTVPVLHKLGQKISDVRIRPDRHWRRKHWRTIQHLYGSAPFFEQHGPALKSFYERDWERLYELNDAMLRWTLKAAGITTPVVRSSELKVAARSTERLVRLVRKAGGTGYLSGRVALEQRLDVDLFAKAGTKLHVQHWRSPQYPQRYSKVGYVPDLAFLDLLLMKGPDAVRQLARGSYVEPFPELASS